MADVHQMALFYQLGNPRSALNVAVTDLNPTDGGTFTDAVKTVLTRAQYNGQADPQPSEIGFGQNAQHYDLTRLNELWDNGTVNRDPETIASTLGIYPGGGPCPPYPLDLKVWNRALA